MPGFDEAYYIANNPDVAAAIAAGQFTSGLQHFQLHGEREGRAGSKETTSGFDSEGRAITTGGNAAATGGGTSLGTSSSNLFDQLLGAQLEAVGFDLEFGEGGQISGVSPGNRLQQRGEIEGLAQERTLAALRGELPVRPGLLRDLSDREETLKNTLRRRLGTGFETSTPGIETLSRFDTFRNEALEDARRGDLSLADTIASGAASRDLFGQTFGPLIGSQTGFGVASIGGAAGVEAARIAGQARLGSANIAAQSGINIAELEQEGSLFGGIGSLLGSLGSAFIGSDTFGSLFS